MKTWYALRTRLDDAEPWGKPMWYRTSRDRDSDARISRCLGGIRCHSYEAKFCDGIDPRDLDESTLSRTLGATERRLTT